MKPVEMTQHAFSAQAGRLMTGVVAGQQPVHGPISLYEAMARALKYNLDYRVKRAKSDLANAQLNLAHYSMLPDVVSKTEYYGRNNQAASKSIDLTTGLVDPNASTSSELDVFSSELVFSWNILDFGLSYVKAKQAADRAVIAREIQRSMKHKLIEEVRVVFWKAVAYGRLIKGLEKLEKRVNAALANIKQLSSGHQTSRIEALNAERELVKIKTAIKSIQADYVGAKTELAKLMNIRPGTPFELEGSARGKMPEHIGMSLDRMLHSAVSNRAEVRQLAYEHRINVNDAHAALLDLLPGLKVYAGPHWNSNSYLVNSNWVSWGASVSWSMLKLLQYPAKKYSIERQRELIQRRALAQTMAVLTQVHVSRARYHHYRENLVVAGQYKSVQGRLTRQVEAETRAARVSGHELLLEQMNALVADAKYDLAYADLQGAYANLYASIGIEPQRHVNTHLSVSQLAAVLERNWSSLTGLRPEPASPPVLDHVETGSTGKHGVQTSKGVRPVSRPVNARPLPVPARKRNSCKSVECWKLRLLNAG